MVAPAARAVALDPEDFTANYWTANELTATGRFTEAEAMIDQIVNRDPANALALYYKCLLRWLAGDKPAASRMAQRAEALGLPLGGFTLAFISAMQGDYDRGAPQYARAMQALGTKFTSAELETIYRGASMVEAERAAGLRVIATRPDDQYVPVLHLLLGEPERSFAEFEHSSTSLPYLNFLWYPDAWSRKARQSPAFQGFAKRIGLLDYWKKNRWPDLCSPTPEDGPDSFTCR